MILGSPEICLAVALKVRSQEERATEFMQDCEKKHGKQNSLWTQLTLSARMIT